MRMSEKCRNNNINKHNNNYNNPLTYLRIGGGKKVVGIFLYPIKCL